MSSPTRRIDPPETFEPLHGAVHNRTSGRRVGSEPLTGSRACSRGTAQGSAADSTARRPSGRSWQTDCHPVDHRLSGAVEIALQVFTYSVAAAKGALDLVQQRFRLVPLVRQLVRGGLALWLHGVEERSVRERELACRLVALACTLIRALVPELVAE